MALFQLLRNARFLSVLISMLVTGIVLAGFFLLNRSEPTALAEPSEKPLARACGTHGNVVICGDEFTLAGGIPNSYKGNVTLKKLGDDQPFVVIDDWIDAN